MNFGAKHYALHLDLLLAAIRDSPVRVMAGMAILMNFSKD